MAADSDEKRWFRVQSIGVVHRPGEDESMGNSFLDPWKESTIEIFPKWEPALEGIEGFSNLVVIFYLDKVSRLRSPGKPRPVEGVDGLKPIGTFATRSPRRPNPIGLSSPELMARDRNLLTVRGLDAWDGTPVIDIKGYYPPDELRPHATVPEWLTQLWDVHRETR